jgi:hypothetical protein
LFVTFHSANAINMFEVMYSPSFVPATIQTNYLGDAGFSGDGTNCGITTTAGTAYTLVVHDVSGTATGSTYTVDLPFCIFGGTPNHVPVAKAKNVLVLVAAPGTTAAANIDNGSSDADGDALTITQTPPGPYPIGMTTVTLTVVDTKGATSQATGVVTVANPDFSQPATLANVTVNAGTPGTTHLAFAPNPGTLSDTTFACSGLPDKSTCAFAPATVVAGSAATDVLITVNTTATTTAALQRPQTFYAAVLPFSALGLLGLVLGIRSKSRRATVFFAFLTLIPLLMPFSGCSSPMTVTIQGTPKGTSTVTVTGTSGGVTHTSTFSLTVN